MKKEELTDSEEAIVSESVQNTYSAYLKYRNYGIVIIPFLTCIGLIKEFAFGGLSIHELILLIVIAIATLIWVFQFRRGFLSIKSDMDVGMKCFDSGYVVRIASRDGKVSLDNGFTLHQFDINFSITNEIEPSNFKIKKGDLVRYQYLPNSKMILHSVQEKKE